MDIIHRFEAIQIEHAHCQHALMALTAQHGLVEMDLQQTTIGQLGQFVIHGHAQQLALLLLDLAGLDKGTDIVRDLAIRTGQGGDGQPVGIDLAVLASVPDLAMPAPLFLDGRPHRMAVCRALPLGIEHARRQAEDFLGAESGPTAEGGIHPDDAQVGIGDHDGFVENIEYLIQQIVEAFMTSVYRARARLAGRTS
jgi:hypothetical protein